jgi:hypothetical protein
MGCLDMIGEWRWRDTQDAPLNQEHASRSTPEMLISLLAPPTPVPAMTTGVWPVDERNE